MRDTSESASVKRRASNAPWGNAPVAGRVLLGVLALLTVVICAPNAAAQPGKGDPFGGGSGFGSLGTPGEEDTEPVTVTASVSRTTVAPGDTLTIAAVMRFAPEWHAWPAAEHVPLPEDVAAWAMETTAGLVEPPAWLRTGPIQWPDAKLTSVAGMPDPLPTYGGTARIFVPALVASDAAPGEYTITVRIGWQACDNTICDQPTSVDLPLSVTVVPVGTPAESGNAEPEAFAGFDPAVFADLSRFTDAEGVSAPVTSPVGNGQRSFFGIAVPAPTDPLGIVLIAILAALGGAILNLTPCVLPVIPIKVMTISAHAGHPGKSLVLGLWMALGVVAFWGGLGLIAASFSAFADPSRLFGIWWVTMGIGVLIGAMGVGIMGAFEIRLPKAVYAVNPKADSPTGSFMFGVMTAVLGLPCFGFVAGALLAGSATLPWGVVLSIFVAIGVGMASPYLVLSAFPALVKKIPRTGPASELVKQVMGLLLLAAAAYFIGSGVIALLGGTAGLPWWGKSIHWWLVGGFALAAGGWLAFQTVRITPDPLRRVAFAFIGLVLALGGVAAAADRTADAYHNIWVPYSEEALADARSRGKTVVLDFTAEWCLNCKALKAAVLSKNPIKPLFQSGRVVPMTVDLTANDAPGWDKLRSLGQTGIPLLVIYGPDTGDTPWMANSYTSGQVLRALALASGQSVETLQIEDAGNTPLESPTPDADN
ncbi:MAG: protein-disulfide reductase DsbD family protein [Phycisphaerales bacterium]